MLSDLLVLITVIGWQKKIAGFVESLRNFCGKQVYQYEKKSKGWY